MDGTVPKIFYNFYLNFMNFLIFLNSRGPGSKFPQGARPLVRAPPAATPRCEARDQLLIMRNHEGHA